VTIGYARVSTSEQHLELQLDALKQVGCDRLYEDRASGSKGDRPGLLQALAALREGDTLVVWKLDQFGRSLKDLVTRIDELTRHGVAFRSLTEGIDTSTAQGKLMLHVFGALAEFERDLIRERTAAGLEAARARGRKGGGKHKLSKKKVQLASALMKGRTTPVKEVCTLLEVGKATLYRYVGPDGELRHPGV